MEPRDRPCGNAAGPSRRVVVNPQAPGSVAAASSQVDLLARLGISLVESGPVPDILARLAAAARELTGARYAAIGVVGPDGILDDFITSGIDAETREKIGSLPRGRGLLGVIHAEDRPVRIADIGADPRSVGFPDGHPPMTSFLGTPIRLGRRHFGNLYVTDATDGCFSASDEQLIEALAAFAAVAIRGGELRQERQRWVEGLEGVCDITAALNRPDRELESVLPEATRRARALLDCDTVGIALGTSESLSVTYAFGVSALRLESAGSFVLASELRSSVSPRECYLARFGARHVAGAIVVVTTGDPGPWRRDVAEILAEHVGGAVTAARAVAEVREGLLEESDARAAELSERLEREAQERALVAQEAERSRIARELHDETGQLLTGISLRLKGLSPRLDDPALEGEVDDLRGHVREVQAAIRRFLRQLRPVDLDKGLSAALVEMTAVATRDSGCMFTSECDSLPPLTEEIEVAIYRIAQESITNILRHSEATEAKVLLTAEGRHIRLSVEDDGRGFSAEQPQAGFGLSGIRERVDLIGGTVRIDSSPGTGTALIVDLSLAAAD